MVAKMNLIVPQGDDFDKSFDLTDDSGAPYDTTGCKFIFGARYNLDEEVLTVEAECNIQMIKGAESTRIMQGDIFVSPGHAYRSELIKDGG